MAHFNISFQRCHKNGLRVVVKPSYESYPETHWTNYLSYVWSGYVIECRNCGEIYRSRQHWYGNKDPEESAVIAEMVHVWPGVSPLPIGNRTYYDRFQVIYYLPRVQKG